MRLVGDLFVELPGIVAALEWPPSLANAAGDWREIRTHRQFRRRCRAALVLVTDGRAPGSLVSVDRWFVSVDNRHIATEASFDCEIRFAKQAVERQHTPQTDGIQRERRTS
ncbi:hypothetical protein ACN8ZM_32860 [Burkholderia aenigmatica]|uniref:hypothetical protein n=1 Tax=Burkholderia aenigmatica TaxID=2015348 RepID=UPI003B42D8EC